MRRLLPLVLLVLAFLASACGEAGPPPTPEGFQLRATSTYQVALPTDWEVVDDVGLRYQVVEPGVETPMTVRISITPGVREDVELDAGRLREAIPAAYEDGRILSDEGVDVVGAEDAVLITHEAELVASDTGDALTIRTLDLLALAPNGHVVNVKVQGPADAFDARLADVVIASTDLRVAA